MLLTVRATEPVPVFDLDSRAGSDDADADRWDETMRQSGSGAVVVSFANAAWLSSRALGMLIHLAKRLRSEGRDMVLADMDTDVAGVFAKTRLDHYFLIEPTAAEAVNRVIGALARPCV